MDRTHPIVDVRREDRFATLALAVLTLGVFAPALSPSRVFFERDIGSYWYPQVASFVRAVTEGAWPAWSPSFTFGLPMWEDPAYQVAYPPTWLNLLFLPATYYKLFVVAHAWWAGLGLYAFLRRLDRSPLASFAGAAAWCLSGPFLSAASLFHHYASASWIGWVLFALVGVLDRRSWRSALLLGGAAGVLALAGSADVAAITAVLCVGLLLGQAGGVRKDSRLIGLLAAAVVFAALVSAIQWLPTAGYLAAVPTRASFRPQDNLYWSVHPASLLDLFVPSLVSDLPWNAGVRASLFEGRAPFLQSLYLGASALGLAVLAFLTRRDRMTTVCSVLFAALVYIALGKHAPGLPSLLMRTKVVFPFRYPAKAMLGGAVLWAVLVALGLHVWLQPWSDRDRRRARAAAAVLLAIALSAGMLARAVASGSLLASLDSTLGPDLLAEATGVATTRLCIAGAWVLAVGLLFLRRGQRAEPEGWSTLLLSVVVLVDLLSAGYAVNAIAPAELLSWRPRVLDRIDRPLDQKRVQAFGFDPADGAWARTHATQGPAGWEPQWTFSFGEYESLMAPSAARWRLAGAFDGDFTGMTPRPIPLMTGILRAGPRAPILRLLRIGAVDYATDVSPHLDRSPAPGLDLVATVPSIYEAPLRLFRVPETLPRVYAVGRSRVVPDTDTALRQILDPAFDLHSEVVLSAGRALVPAGPFQGSARIVGRKADRVSIDVDASQDGYVVLVESYLPAWRATVDGAAAEVVRANAAFRAVAVPAGHHRVEMSYLPRSILWGCALSGGALLGALAWAVRGRLRDTISQSALSR
jgi:Bacterial membrane protein YfhO